MLQQMSEICLAILALALSDPALFLPWPCSYPVLPKCLSLGEVLMFVCLQNDAKQCCVAAKLDQHNEYS